MTKLDIKDSLVITMLNKALERDVPVNIAIEMSSHNRAFGKIDRVQYWADEGILNIEFIDEASVDVPWRREWRYRPLTMKMLDSHLHLKKIDGVLTLVTRPQEEEEPIKEAYYPIVFNDKELTMAGSLVLRTIQKWLGRGEPVFIDYINHRGITASGRIRSLKLQGDAYQCIQMPVNGPDLPEHGFETSAWFTHLDFNRMHLSTGERFGKKALLVSERKDEAE